jgi:dinuclear metal center YbgI/SA1388 family protein
MTMTRQDLVRILARELNVDLFNDYCPNGLQVEGRERIHRLVTGVTACQALLDAAVALEADAVLVHHGYFWKSEPAQVVGMKANRLRTLLGADINLFAYHLPLDCHPTLGNNAGLGALLGVVGAPVSAADPTLPVMGGELTEVNTVAAVAQRLKAGLGREVIAVGEGDVRRIAWCTGGGQHYIDLAADLGFDLFVTGEISEQTVHSARERGIGFIAAGHHATERFGVQALGEWLAKDYGLEHCFVDIDSPA